MSYWDDEASKELASARRAGILNSIFPGRSDDGIDESYGSEIQRNEHEARGLFGSIKKVITFHKIDQTDHYHETVKSLTESGAHKLQETSPTGAKFKTGRANSWNVGKITAFTYEADRIHGWKPGGKMKIDGGEVEIVSDRKVTFRWK